MIFILGFIIIIGILAMLALVSTLFQKHEPARTNEDDSIMACAIDELVAKIDVERL